VFTLGRTNAVGRTVVFCLFFIGVLALGGAAYAYEGLLAYWPLDDGAGQLARDLSANGNNGILGSGPSPDTADPSWVTDPVRGTVLEWAGDNGPAQWVDLTGHLDNFRNLAQGTILAWIKIPGGDVVDTILAASDSGDASSEIRFYYEQSYGGLLFDIRDGSSNPTGEDGQVVGGTTVEDDNWHHVAITVDSSKNAVIYADGQPVGDGEEPFFSDVLDLDLMSLGRNVDSGGTQWVFQGRMSDVAVFDRPLSGKEILEIANGAGIAFTERAAEPNPADGATDIAYDTTLAWKPGQFAAAHDIYFGTAYDDVNDASRADPRGVLASEAQDVNALDPGRLAFGQTYYWRVDEVNAAPDHAIFKGDVWRFEAEPLSIPVTQITATASSSQGAGTGPEKTVDGSGLDELDQHSVDATHMWLSGMGDPTPSIQYAFDTVYKLDHLRVWNSNQLIETFVGLGAKDVVIETSVDGAEWATLEGPIQLAQATGAATYTANTTIDFGGIMAQYVRITVNSGWGFLPQYGISELRFFYMPIWAREPVPADGADTDEVDVTLKWRSGREAASHEVSLGTDSANLALIATVPDNRLDLSDQDLQYGTTYFWTVREVNEAETPPTYDGPVWHFTTPPYGTVDDFDQYDDNCNRIFFAWQDGLGHNGGEDIEDCDEPVYNGNSGGSIVGNNQAPFAEKTIVNTNSQQSMPFSYDNAFGDSYATLALDGQDWSAHGIKTLALVLRGTAGNTGSLYVKINNTKILYDLEATDIASGAWLAWNIDLSGVSGLQNVTSLTIGVDGSSAAGMLYIDDIRLHPQVGALFTPMDPGDAGLVAHYSFEGKADDMSGNGHHGVLEGAAQIVPGHSGNALDCDGFSGYVSTGKLASDLGIDGNKARTVTCWIYTRSFNNGGLYDLGNRSDGQDFSLRTLTTENRWRIQYWGGAFDIDFTHDSLDKWVHITHVHDGSHTQIYADGIRIVDGPVSLDTGDNNPWQIGRYGWPDAYFDGMIDELRLYNRALTPEEALGAAGRTSPIHKPL
jgi:hypothetical protein